MQSPDLKGWCLACSICGSDMHPYAGRGVPLDSGITFGHEFTGQVVAAGSEVRWISCRWQDTAPCHCPAVVPNSEVLMWAPVPCMATACSSCPALAHLCR